MDRRGLGLIDRIDPPPIPSPGLICVVHRILIKIDCNKNTDKTAPRPTPHTVGLIHYPSLLHIAAVRILVFYSSSQDLLAEELFTIPLENVLYGCMSQTEYESWPSVKV